MEQTQGSAHVDRVGAGLPIGTEARLEKKHTRGAEQGHGLRVGQKSGGWAPVDRADWALSGESWGLGSALDRVGGLGSPWTSGAGLRVRQSRGLGSRVDRPWGGSH